MHKRNAKKNNLKFGGSSEQNRNNVRASAAEKANAVSDGSTAGLSPSKLSKQSQPAKAVKPLQPSKESQPSKLPQPLQLSKESQATQPSKESLPSKQSKLSKQSQPMKAVKPLQPSKESQPSKLPQPLPLLKESQPLQLSKESKDLQPLQLSMESKDSQPLQPSKESKESHPLQLSKESQSSKESLPLQAPQPLQLLKKLQPLQLSKESKEPQPSKLPQPLQLSKESLVPQPSKESLVPELSKESLQLPKPSLPEKALKESQPLLPQKSPQASRPPQPSLPPRAPLLTLPLQTPQPRQPRQPLLPLPTQPRQAPQPLRAPPAPQPLWQPQRSEIGGQQQEPQYENNVQEQLSGADNQWYAVGKRIHKDGTTINMRYTGLEMPRKRCAGNMGFIPGVTHLALELPAGVMPEVGTCTPDVVSLMNAIDFFRHPERHPHAPAVGPKTSIQVMPRNNNMTDGAISGISLVPLNWARTTPLKRSALNVAFQSYSLIQLEMDHSLSDPPGRVIFNAEVSPTYMLSTHQQMRLKDAILDETVPLTDALLPIVEDLYQEHEQIHSAGLQMLPAPPYMPYGTMEFREIYPPGYASPEMMSPEQRQGDTSYYGDEDTSYDEQDTYIESEVAAMEDEGPYRLNVRSKKWYPTEYQLTSNYIEMNAEIMALNDYGVYEPIMYGDWVQLKKTKRIMQRTTFESNEYYY